jgi:DNA-binding IclR family transcriptional regulator
LGRRAVVTDHPDRVPRGESGLQAVDRLVRIFEAVAAGPVPLTKVAAETGLSDATALRYLNSLVTHGLLERDPDTRHFRIGVRMFLLGRSANWSRGFMSVATSVMSQLLDQFDETVNLGARLGNNLVIVHALESSQPIRMGASVGETDTWHSSGLGKAILSTLPVEETKALLAEHALLEFTPRTLTTPDDLLRDLNRVRARGFAIDDEETVEGLRCAAAPIRSAEGTARYAISVSAPAFRLPHTRLLEVGEAVRAKAQTLEELLGYGPEPDQAVP